MSNPAEEAPWQNREYYKYNPTTTSGLPLNIEPGQIIPCFNLPEGTNPKDLLGVKKVQLHLVPPSSIIYEALAFEDGANKYGPYNWRKNKVILSIYIDALLRHVFAYFDGEDNAPDSKKPHLAHAKACLGVLIDALETGNLIDDRPNKGKAAELLERFKKESG